MIKEIPFKDHDEWLTIRHKYIGGSDAAAVIGLSPYKSAYTLWAEKTNRISPFTGNITTRVGAYLEDLVAHLFEEESNKKVRRKNFTLVNDAYPFACANIDRAVIGENAFLEIKTTTSIPAIKQIKGAVEFPELYYTQCVHYMAVGGFQKCYLAVLINCRELKVFELERDQAEIDALMQAEKEFWSCVESDVPPMADGSESTSDTLRGMYPVSEGDGIDINAMSTELDEYNELTKAIKNLEEVREARANAIKEYMQAAPEGRSEKWSVSYKTTEKKTFDAKRYESENPTLDLSKYYKTTSYRTFKITPIKKGTQNNG